MLWRFSAKKRPAEPAPAGPRTPDSGECRSAEEGDSTPDTAQILWLAELACWFSLALAPLLYWVNGPAVSTDQLVVRSVVVGIALGAGGALRLVKMLTAASQDSPVTSEQ
ncbi:MAG: hypothetical protein WD847_19090 [Pirellulales bacterium]